MASSTGKAIGASRGGDYWHIEPEKIRIAQRDPEHPGHAAHMARTSLSNPDFALLVDLIRELGFETGSTIYYFRDPPNAPEPTAATGKRRVEASCIVNAEWKKARDPRYPIMIPMIRTDDPVMAENVENAARAADPPLVLARRFLAACRTMSEAKAAASVGMRLGDARDAVKLLSAAPELQAAVNAREIPLDVAKRVAKKGQRAAAKAIEEATPKGGKVDAKALGRAAKADPGPRLRARPAALARGVAEALAVRKRGQVVGTVEGIRDETRALAEFFAGDDDALNGYTRLKKIVASAGWSQKKDAEARHDRAR